MIHNEGLSGALLGFAQNINISNAFSDINIKSFLDRKTNSNVIGFTPKLRNVSITDSYANYSLIKNEIENRFDPLVFDYKDLKLTNTFYNSDLGASKITEAKTKTSDELKTIFNQAFNYDPSEEEIIRTASFSSKSRRYYIVKNQIATIDFSESIDPDGDDLQSIKKIQL